MNARTLSIRLAIPAALLSSCALFPAAPTPTATAPAPPTDTLVPPVTASPSGPCMIVAEADVNVYKRPSMAADIFGTLSAGETIQPMARTADGWFGFDPGVAQAANMGVFRYRWVEQGTPGLTFEGGCSSLPIVVGPPVGVCFDMPMDSVPVYNAPSSTASVLATMVPENYAAILGKSVDGLWMKVDLGQGNTGLTVIGWVQGTSINMNGPCDSLPTVSP